MKKALTLLRNRLIVFFHDVGVIPLAWLGAYWLHFDLAKIPPYYLYQATITLPTLLMVQMLVYWSFGLYRGIWRFASLPDLARILKAILVATLLYILWLFLNARLFEIPPPIFPMYALLSLTFLGGSRFLYRWYKDRAQIEAHTALLTQRILIVGAGKAGEGIVRDLHRHIHKKYKVVAFIDDKKSKRGHEIHGIRVLGDSKDIPLIVKNLNVDLIIIAIPSIRSADMCRIVEQCEQSKVPFRTLPSLYDIANGSVKIQALRPVSLEDLLGSDPIQLDEENIRHTFENKVVLISGGAGSIGSELCKLIACLKPNKIIVIESNEFNLYLLEQEFSQKFPGINFLGCLLDITDQIAVMRVLKQDTIDIIIHAAAYKYVPMLESQLRAVVKNNILGTQILAEAAVVTHVKSFLLISSDKAVNPINLIGVTKRVSEIFCQNYSLHSNTKFIVLRFGNIFATTGSVIPLFRKQIEMGGPVTITHPEISRFFMTMREVTQLILQVTAIGNTGETFILDMGDPIKILYLAEQMILLSGLVPYKDIEIKYTGLRLGEKIHEELFYKSEAPIATAYKKILKTSHQEKKDWEELTNILKNINLACQMNDEKSLRSLLLKIVPEYQGNIILQEHTTQEVSI